ncbi:hypothetical protein [Kineococcus arenarius]|uniref:hypothetical protein n=1 Tax=Kineococcus sp. SYSU DK007 TaxID=3383128 RepID=UPI003D7F03D8
MSFTTLAFLLTVLAAVAAFVLVRPRRGVLSATLAAAACVVLGAAGALAVMAGITGGVG